MKEKIAFRFGEPGWIGRYINFDHHSKAFFLPDVSPFTFENQKFTTLILDLLSADPVNNSLTDNNSRLLLT